MEPIIKAYMTELNAQMEEDILKVCHSYGIDVNKERLMQALTDARKFYDEGYREGKRDVVRHSFWESYSTSAYGGYKDGEVRWLPRQYYRCERCRKGSAIRSHYCPNCGAKMDGDSHEA